MNKFGSSDILAGVGPKLFIGIFLIHLTCRDLKVHHVRVFRFIVFIRLSHCVRDLSLMEKVPKAAGKENSIRVLNHFVVRLKRKL